MNKIIYVFLFIASFFLTGYIIYQLYLGYAHFFSSLWLHFVFFFLLSFLIKLLFPSWEKSKWRLRYWSGFLTIILLELSLRFIIPLHLSYMERNGKLIHINPYRQMVLESKHQFFPKDKGIRISSAHSCNQMIRPEFVYEHCYNGMGLRNKDYSREELDRSFQIMAMGDSFTNGIGTSQDSTWPKVLEQHLQLKRPEVITLNAGNSGSDLFFEWYKLKHYYLDSLEPKIVLFEINASDLNDIISRGGKERFTPEQGLQSKRGPWWNNLYAVSHVSRLIIHQVFKVQYHFHTNKQYKKVKAETIEKMHRLIIEEIIPLAEAHHFKVMFIFSVGYHEIKYDNFDLEPLYNLLPESTDTYYKFQLQDDLSKFSKDDQKLLELYWERDLHCTPKGYALWAEYIGKELDRIGWVKDSLDVQASPK